MSETINTPTEQQPQELNSGPQESSDKDTAKPKTSLEKYCDDNPSASECLIYEE